MRSLLILILALALATQALADRPRDSSFAGPTKWKTWIGDVDSDGVIVRVDGVSVTPWGGTGNMPAGRCWSATVTMPASATADLYVRTANPSAASEVTTSGDAESGHVDGKIPFTGTRYSVSIQDLGALQIGLRSSGDTIEDVHLDYLSSNEGGP